MLTKWQTTVWLLLHVLNGTITASAAMSSAWRTRFTAKFPARLPLMGAPMAGVSGGALAAETCRAGGLGFIAAGHCINSSCLQELEDEIAIFRQKCSTEPLCIGWIGFSSFGNEERFRLYEEVLTKHKPAVVQFFAPSISHHPSTQKTNVEMAKDHNAKVLLQVGSVAEGLKAIESGADGIIAQGSEAGGHGLRREMGSGTLPLAARLVQLAAQAPHHPIVLAAGGIADGRGVAAALALGCDGAVLGTRLWASKEALNKESLKQKLAATTSGDGVERTRAFDQIINTYTATPWPSPYDSVGALRNELTEKWSVPQELDKELAREGSELVANFKAATKGGDPTIAQVLSGEGVGEIDAIESTHDIMARIDQEARSAIQNMSNLLG